MDTIDWFLESPPIYWYIYDAIQELILRIVIVFGVKTEQETSLCNIFYVVPGYYDVL